MDLLNHGYPEFAVGRAYYAMFHCATAALLAQGHVFSKHSAVIAAFGQYLIKSGELSADLHQVLRHAFDRRNLGDYGTDPGLISPEEARLSVKEAEEFMIAVADFLKRQGFDV